MEDIKELLKEIDDCIAEIEMSNEQLEERYKDLYTDMHSEYGNNESLPLSEIIVSYRKYLVKVLPELLELLCEAKKDYTLH